MKNRVHEFEKEQGEDMGEVGGRKKKGKWYNSIIISKSNIINRKMSQWLKDESLES